MPSIIDVEGIGEKYTAKLQAAGIKTIRDLVQKTESEMLKYRNFGRKSLTEIKNILKEMGLSFNMKLDETGMPIMSGEEKENS